MFKEIVKQMINKSVTKDTWKLE